MFPKAWVGLCFERDGRLVVRGPASDVDDDPAVGQRDVRHLVTRLAADDRLAAKYVGIEAPGTLDIIRNDEVGQDHLRVEVAMMTSVVGIAS
jgi:hypothetical protein